MSLKFSMTFYILSFQVKFIIHILYIQYKNPKKRDLLGKKSHFENLFKKIIKKRLKMDPILINQLYDLK